MSFLPLHHQHYTLMSPKLKEGILLLKLENKSFLMGFVKLSHLLCVCLCGKYAFVQAHMIVSVPQVPSVIFLRQGLSLVLTELARQSPKVLSACLHLRKAGLQVHTSMLGRFKWVLEIKLRSS